MKQREEIALAMPQQDLWYHLMHMCIPQVLIMNLGDILTHGLPELFAKNTFFGHFGGFQAGFRPY